MDYPECPCSLCPSAQVARQSTKTHKALGNLAADAAEWSLKLFFFHPYHSHLAGDEAAGGCDAKKGVDGTGLSSSVLHYCMCAGKVD